MFGSLHDVFSYRLCDDWAIVNSKSKLTELMNGRLINCLFNSGAGPRAGRKRAGLPIREGGFERLVNELKSRELIDVVSPDFLAEFWPGATILVLSVTLWWDCTGRWTLARGLAWKSRCLLPKENLRKSWFATALS